MSWVTCPKCRKLTPDYNANCIGCGVNLKEAERDSGAPLKTTYEESVASKSGVEANMIISFAVIGVVLLLLFGMLRGCRPSGEMMVAEFRTLGECLQNIERNSGQKLSVVTDKPTEVSGKLSGGGFFSCTQISSGTKGLYYEGSYSK